ncbi:hypothetical protein AGMMS49525_01290 [Bacteroidia bacterium]|nr:hypothetical protein AGMMS49525_01290 [Bacteroidia bacterium]
MQIMNNEQRKKNKYKQKKLKKVRKKQLFFSLLGMVALSSSCATDLYQSNPLQSSEREISFKTFADKQLRASVTTAGAMTSFTTSAWSHPDAAVSAADPYNGYVLNGVTVTRSEGGASWDYFPKANRPARDSVDFFAYSPASSVNVTAGLKQAPSVTTLLPPVPRLNTPCRDGTELINKRTSWCLKA